MIMLTPREALEIQERQVKHYSGGCFAEIGKNLAERVAKLNDVAGLDLDKPVPSRELIKRIPRGASIENLLGIS
jgi:hypothetical protein